MIDYFKVIHKYIDPESALYPIYVAHVVQVTAKALKIARRLGLDDGQLCFIEEAAMLHDIGIVRVNDPKLGCYGTLHYICHGTEGRAMLEAEGLPRHALVCERHTGNGLTVEGIDSQKLPIPRRDMCPQSEEEQVICWSDIFFRKSPGYLWGELSVEDARATVAKYGEWQGRKFDEMLEKYGA